MFHLLTNRGAGHRRRAATIALTAITLFVLLGFAALAVDVGAIYNIRADLQRSADAGAIAAAAALSDVGLDGDPRDIAARSAQRFVERNLVLGDRVTIDAGQDVVVGRADFDRAANVYHFRSTTVMPNAVRVTVRKTEDSPNGAAELFFATIFGRRFTNIRATAVAAVAPRDIALVADVSGSLRYDSLLENYDNRTINVYDVWDGLPGGALEEDSTWEDDELPADLSQAAGPGWGFFKTLLFGTDPAEDDYDPATDPGLIRMVESTWNDARLESYLLEKGYSANEVSTIMNSTQSYENRVAAALGLADWRSGKAGGRWALQGVSSAATGDGDDQVESGELVWTEDIFGILAPDSANIWARYIDYVKDRGPFQYRFGVKTFVGYLLQQRSRPDQTPELAQAPLQPIQAVKDAVMFMTDLLDRTGSDDLVSLEVYDVEGVHEVDLTNSLGSISARMNQMLPGHYGSGTNIGGGLERAIEELTSSRTRASARRLIVLLTDGQANRSPWGSASAGEYALYQAERAADQGIQIIAVSVGQDADQNIMREIAEVGHGIHFHAEGSIEEYSQQLAAIFMQIGGMRAPQLIE